MDEGQTDSTLPLSIVGMLLGYIVYFLWVGLHTICVVSVIIGVLFLWDRLVGERRRTEEGMSNLPLQVLYYLARLCSPMLRNQKIPIRNMNYKLIRIFRSRLGVLCAHSLHIWTLRSAYGCRSNPCQVFP